MEGCFLLFQVIWFLDSRIACQAWHTLIDGKVVKTFRIPLQNNKKPYLTSSSTSYSYGASESFNIKGTTNIELKDTDGTLIGKFDGVIDTTGSIDCEFKSIDLTTYSYVITEIVAHKI